MDDIAHEVHETLTLLTHGGPSAVIEIRSLDSRGGVGGAGYFTDLGAAAQSAAGVSRYAAGVYVTLNAIDARVLSRSSTRNTMLADVKSGTLTSAGDIVRLHWLLIDHDPARPSGISSSNIEHAAALARAREIRAWLRSRQWPEPVLASSGNGGHLLSRIDLPNTPENVALLKAILQALDARFSDSAVRVDPSTFKPAQLTKAYGTRAQKGANTPDRPHRYSTIIERPDEIVAVTQAQLAALAAEGSASTTRGRRSGGEGFDLGAWLAEHDVAVRRQKPHQGGTLYELATCV